MLGPYDPASRQSPGVDYAWPERHQYQAWIDLVTQTEDTARALIGDAISDAARSLLGAVHVYPVTARYTIVWQGRPTEVGLRGWPAVFGDAVVSGSRRD